MSMLTIAAKDLLQLRRDRGTLAFILLVPVAVITIVAASLSGGDMGGNLTLPVVNEDQGPVAEVLIEALGEYVRVEEMSRERAEALVSVEKAAAAALVLPERLSKNYLANRSSKILLLTDPAKGAELATIKAIFLMADRDAAALADPFYEELLSLQEQSLTGSRLTTSSFEQNIPGFSLMFVLMGTLFGVAFALEDEQSSGTLVRLRMAPIGLAALLGGKLLARYGVGLVQMMLLFGFGRAVFGLHLGPSIATFALLCACIVFAMTGFSLLAASFARTREQIIPLGLTVVMIVCSIGGCWWPLFQEPLWLQRAAHLFLTAWSMEGLHDLILRERGLGDVWPTMAVLIAYGAGSAGLGALLLRRRLTGRSGP